MCTVCGCGDAKLEGHSHSHDHGHGHDHGHHHHHGHDHVHGPDCGCGTEVHVHRPDPQGARAGGDLHFGHGPAGVEVPGMSQARLIEIETDVLAKNDGYAAVNRRLLGALGVLALNLVSSPGSGKTTLLVKTIEALSARPAPRDVAVIEGDQQTSNDADRIRATGAPAVQVNTGKGCHLDAHMVQHALEHLPLPAGAILFIENVGNLVCPAGFDLGEAAKVAILSVTEGEDKPLKYPDMFAAARIAVLNKTDLAPHCDVDLDLYEANLRRVNPAIEVIRLSARTGEGMEHWLAWLDAEAERAAQRDRAAE
ncbi:hydrogenase nickel incorporation protein HypB [Albimonas sp. CAU 1670]|uniref:hydrogenase nickel incorporation protein HypB n=1 Tax=Albimonas sp. CAU 1670 TaxID=3032599 RepID=UPI0023DB381B|nr:hydrogenase nickel incorporation protein HypB [Albimonas sp. CAU 1670]MDF2235636.1 hydrogenase nickel incorporation protein HypB [Albimonas sp. CAU 1670]